MSGRIRKRFDAARRDGRAAFIPFLTAGDPDLDTTARLLREIDRGGADLIEIGVPFSDPVADGVVIQKASERALAAGADLDRILTMVETVRADLDAALVLFSYVNPVLRYGLDRFARRAAEAGVDGVLTVDLPPEEAGEYRAALGTAGLDTVFLLAPTSTDERVREIAAASSGFVYYVSRTGVTGARDRLDDEVRVRLQRIRALVGSLPIAVGFGISRPEHVAALRGLADGVVVGSALVALIAAGGPADAVGGRVRRFVADLRAAAAVRRDADGDEPVE